MFSKKMRVAAGLKLLQQSDAFRLTGLRGGQKLAVSSSTSADDTALMPNKMQPSNPNLQALPQSLMQRNKKKPDDIFTKMGKGMINCVKKGMGQTESQKLQKDIKKEMVQIADQIVDRLLPLPDKVSKKEVEDMNIVDALEQAKENINKQITKWVEVKVDDLKPGHWNVNDDLMENCVTRIDDVLKELQPIQADAKPTKKDDKKMRSLIYLLKFACKNLKTDWQCPKGLLF